MRKPQDIAILAADGFITSSITGPCDLFSVANAVVRQGLQPAQGRTPPFRWGIYSLGGQPVRGHSGCALSADGSLAELGRPKVLLVPGLGIEDIAELPACLARLAPFQQALRQAHARGALIAGICTGNFLLAEAGLLEGKQATISWWLVETFRRRYPGVRLRLDRLVTRSGNIFCGGAGASYFDTTLAIITELAGAALARDVARFFVVDNNRPGQAAYMMPLLQRDGDPAIAAAQAWIRRKLDQALSIGALADHLAMSERTLLRHFHAKTGKSPKAYIQDLRLGRAKELLETSTQPLGAIVAAIGYQDESTFRRLFKRATGLTPQDYRKRFRTG